MLDVHATLSMKARVLHTGGGRKTDAADTRAVGWAAQHHEGLRPVAAEDHAEILNLLTHARDGLKGDRTRALNRLHDLLRNLIAGGVPRGLTSTRARAALRGLRASTAIEHSAGVTWPAIWSVRSPGWRGSWTTTSRRSPRSFRAPAAS
ncbi:IS110 family transposase [Kocuria sp. CH-021]|uniref:IS110 family transposase n=1 Tax=Kocuria sp. CH-021 TaxID=3406735 RepID=UPI003C796772